VTSHFTHCYCDHLIVAMSYRVMSHESVATQGHNSNGRSMISSRPVATKVYSSRATQLVTPHSQKVGLTNISNGLQQDLRATLI
jgi:hypothetical protein